MLVAAFRGSVDVPEETALFAASAFTEKNQNAFTRFGTSVAKRTTSTSPEIEDERVDLIQKQGESVGL